MMKKSLLSLTITLGISFNTLAQNKIDANGNPALNKLTESRAEAKSYPLRNNSSSAVIVNQIPSPTSSPGDIAFDGENLWVEGYSEFMLYKISPLDGAILKTIPTGIMRPYGLAFGNGHLWVTDADNHLIQQVDTSNGNVISSFPTPSTFTSSYPGGLAWNGQDLWLNDAMNIFSNPDDSTYLINTSGQILQAHHAIGTYVTGLAWDGQYLWSSDNNTLEIYKIEVASFTAIDTINAPGGLFPNGLEFDGQYLWVANNWTDSLYQIDISGTATGVATIPFTNDQGMNIYPNPANDIITVSITKDKIGSGYIIIDQNGRKVTEGKLTNETTIVDISQLDPGVYLFQSGLQYKKSFRVIKK